MKLDAEGKATCQLRHSAVQRHGPRHGGRLVEDRRRPWRQGRHHPRSRRRDRQPAALPGARGQRRICASTSPIPMRRLATTSWRLTGNDAVGVDAASAVARRSHLEAGAQIRSDACRSSASSRATAASRDQPLGCLRACRSTRLSMCRCARPRCRSPSAGVMRSQPAAALTIDKRPAGRQRAAGRLGRRQRHPLGRLRHSGAADDARPLSLWLRRADDEPRPAAALSRRNRQADRHARRRRTCSKRVQDAIYRVLSYQSSAGSFGLWGPGSGDLLARCLCHRLPDPGPRTEDTTCRNRRWCRRWRTCRTRCATTSTSRTRATRSPMRSTCLRATSKAAISDLRYYADTMINDFPTPLAKAHIAAALALYGDASARRHLRRRSQMSAQSMAPDVSLVAHRLRFGRCATARRSWRSPPKAGRFRRSFRNWSRPVAQGMRTQQAIRARRNEAWMLLAARAVAGRRRGPEARRQWRRAHRRLHRRRMTGDALLADPLTIDERDGRHRSRPWSPRLPPRHSRCRPAATALPSSAPITRSMARRRMSARRSRTSAMSSCCMSPKPTTGRRASLVTDLLPAGFQIDNPSLVDSAHLDEFRLARRVRRRRIPSSATTASSPPSTARTATTARSRSPMSCARSPRRLRSSGCRRRGHVPAAVLGAHRDRASMEVRRSPIGHAAMKISQDCDRIRPACMLAGALAFGAR